MSNRASTEEQASVGSPKVTSHASEPHSARRPVTIVKSHIRTRDLSSANPELEAALRKEDDSPGLTDASPGLPQRMQVQYSADKQH